jgi:hypothetical protein
VTNAKCPVAILALTTTKTFTIILAGSVPIALPSTLITVRSAFATYVPDVRIKTSWSVLNAPRLNAKAVHNKMSPFFNVALTWTAAHVFVETVIGLLVIRDTVFGIARSHHRKTDKSALGLFSRCAGNPHQPSQKRHSTIDLYYSRTLKSIYIYLSWSAHLLEHQQELQGV